MRTRPSIRPRGQQRWSALLLAAAIGLAASPVFASDATLLFEGALHASGGGPASDGDSSLTFALYDAVDGKTALWTESAKVAVAGGRLQHVLGSVQALDAAVAEKSALWLGVTVQGEPELPRQPMHAGFWALRAGSTAVAKAVSCTGCVSVAALKFDGDLDLGGNGIKAATVTVQKVTAPSPRRATDGPRHDVVTTSLTPRGHSRYQCSKRQRYPMTGADKKPYVNSSDA